MECPRQLTGKKVGCEPLLAMGAPKNPQDNPPGKTKQQASLSRLFWPERSHPRGQGTRQGKAFLSFPIPIPRRPRQRASSGAWRSGRRIWGQESPQNTPPQGFSSVKWGFRPISLALGLKERTQGSAQRRPSGSRAGLQGPRGMSCRVLLLILGAGCEAWEPEGHLHGRVGSLEEAG